MAAYIKGISALSPQNTFVDRGFPDEIINYDGISRLKCIEPPYRDFIDPMVSRRMSRIVKMGVCCALKCMQNSDIEMPDGIIAGSGLGCLEDTEKFLASIYTGEEKLLNPTPFIQSTHNTVAGAIALAIKCHNYNATYTHRGFSFESAIQDAMMQLSESPGLNILTGGFDELTENVYVITKRLGLWRNKSAIAGEGVAFFMLSGTKGPKDLARLTSVGTAYKPADRSEIENFVINFLYESGKKPEDIDLIMPGINGDGAADLMMSKLLNTIFNQKPKITFKQFCGEYDTSSSFAMWLATCILNQQHIPAGLIHGDIIPENINNILIYNHLRGINHSLYLLERC